MNIFNKLSILASVLMAFSLVSCHEAQETMQPNILFILADDLGYADLGCYGNQIIRTPNIDQLASEGVSFTECYAGASVCSPSRGTLMTGLHTGHSRIRGNMCPVGGIEGIKETEKGNSIVRRVNLLPEDSTLGNIFTNNGYETAVVNKWHMEGFNQAAGPLDRGFKEFYGWMVFEPKSHNFYPSIRWRNREEYTIEDNLNDKKVDHNTDRSTSEAIDYIRRHKNDKFFLYLAYNAPHVPLDAKSLGDYAKDDRLGKNDKSYAALITHMDECVGRVLEELKSQGLDKNTIVIFASDNGGASAAKTENIKPNGTLCGWKGQLYEGGIKVPLIIKMPNGENAGVKSEFPCYFPDLMPTLVELAKLNTTIKGDGVSIAPEIMEPNSMNAEQRALYWEQYAGNAIQQALRKGDWKLILDGKNQTMELFNLKNDPTEKQNMADRNSEKLAELQAIINSEHVESANWPTNKLGHQP